MNVDWGSSSRRSTVRKLALAARWKSGGEAGRAAVTRGTTSDRQPAGSEVSRRGRHSAAEARWPASPALTGAGEGEGC